MCPALKIGIAGLRPFDALQATVACVAGDNSTPLYDDRSGSHHVYA